MLLLNNIHQYSTKLINLGAGDEMSSLQAIRQKYLNIFNYLLLVLCVGLSIVNIYHSAYAKLIVDFSSFLIYSISVYLTYKEKMVASTITTCTFLNLVIFSGCYFHFFEPVEIVPQMIYAMSSTLFLLPNNRVRIFYITICSILLTILVFKYNFKLDKTIPTLVQIIICLIMHNFFMIFVESQDHKLNTTVSELETSNLNIEKLNEFLTIKNKEITTFTHIMTHDLKAPLNAINSFSSLIADKADFENPKEAAYFSYIENSSKSMQSLVDDLLQYMSIDYQALNKESVDLNNILEEVISSFEFELIEQQVTIHKEVLPTVSGDQQLIKTVFHNLISNSIKYQPKHSINHTPSIQINMKDIGNYHSIFIKDNGIGIKEKHIPNLFEPFKRFHGTSYKGTGLGMSICKRAMDKMNGTIQLINSSDNGSEFKLKFLKK